MAAHIPEKFRDLVSTKKTFAHLATVSPNGQRQGSPVWIDADGDLLPVNSAEAHIDQLAKKYLGLDTYPLRAPGEVRVIYKIEPLSVSTME
jgi:hypothetical protein